ncbi:mitochondrial distribution and morphology protein 10 [Podospora fimiseda]|uniref:Mitochondrial distribution and morphology protein 10 n=1 Tax=Podospora fimiseda TaxID=252190 RepID=A0AAN6YMC1_9PEZI|nr:mitochondrial distribution and morphology protein 10 [Podospora fimiseda]
MREFMHYITNAFYGATGWSEDNSYKDLNATSRELIDFPLPRGLRLTLSSLATPHFGTSYQLGSVGVVDGSISYLYSTVPLAAVPAQSDEIPLAALLRSYRRLQELGSRERQWFWSTGEPTVPVPPRTPDNDKSSLLYGRLYLPQSLLEGLVVKRFSSELQVQVSAVSEQSLRNGGTVLGLVQYDKGKYGIEGLASTDGGLLGVRGLYNFGGDAKRNSKSSQKSEAQIAAEKEGIYGRFSAGGELYYGTLNKSGGMSLGMRFATLPTHRGTPLTATVTVNPLMGNINTSYAVMARDYCSLATRMEFNVYSYESDWAVGMELWSDRRPAGFLLGADPTLQLEIESQPVTKIEPRPEPPRPKERSFQAKMEWRLDEPEPEPQPAAESIKSVEGSMAENKKEEYLGVLKARLDQNLRVGLLWEGRAKSLIFSLGMGVDLHRLDEPFRSLGLEVQYSS